MIVTPVKFAIHEDETNPIFGADTLHITINDDGAGMFLTIENVNPTMTEDQYIGVAKISLGVPDIQKIAELALTIEQEYKF